ncbi:mycothiol system anti-sigma-R factor [Corynebacterium sp. HMSC22B11]|uniref:mycothiol system anti-sigma-R factor n=1 Tax=Corynebacterium sp. HMSC22B11 TaxID=1581056 RepID=UPI0008A2EFC2|nr:mycothiol system anti-sigma-R factor [Corynebacterium sp. HMSC22B11]OFO14128.1 mycothiol system anti-sigma-R factor [Corynebacterium sp. HMSC22B11]
MSDNVEPNAGTPRRDIECRDLVDVLYEYVDGGCDESLRAQLQQHLDSCPSCVEKLGVEREIRQLLRVRCTQVAPVELRSRITSQLRVVYRASQG